MASEFDKNKWIWKMDYCKQKRIPPGESWAWDLAEKAYLKMKELQNG